ncbi:hypothetical protein PR001_g32741, partial [Phytophthora rubi]
TGSEPWVIVQGVQSVLEAVHTTTGLPWWATLMLSGVTVCAAIFPFYVFPIEAMQRLMQARLQQAILGLQVRAYIHVDDV